MWKCMYCNKWHEDKQPCPDIRWHGCLPPDPWPVDDRSSTVDEAVSTNNSINTNSSVKQNKRTKRFYT